MSCEAPIGVRVPLVDEADAGPEPTEVHARIRLLVPGEHASPAPTVASEA